MSVVQRNAGHTKDVEGQWSTGIGLFNQRRPIMQLVYDVVCGMSAEDGLWTSKSDYKGKTYSFCCDGCKSAFEKAPEYHLSNFAEEHPGINPVPEK